MKLIRLKPALIAALLLCQSDAIGLMGVPQAQQAVWAFNFGKKKTAAADPAAASSAPDAAPSGDSKQESKQVPKQETKKESGDDESKEKVKGKSKAEIQEEEELQAEYDAYQKELTSQLKTVKTPFGSTNQKADKEEDSELSPMSINGGASSGPSLHQSLGARLLPAKVYIPGRMMIGHPAEFTIKGRPGYWAALAMADKDKGAKPIYGHDLRLGPDRKVVALGKIGAGGVLTLKIFAPVEGDLVGGNLYFEAAVWPENAPERLEIAQPISSESQTAAKANSVAITGQGERKHGVKLIPDNRSPYARVNGTGITSGSPL